MSEQFDALAGQFDEHRARLRAIAARMLGSTTDGDDAVQAAWLKVQRAGADGIDNIGAWFTTILARVALDMLRARRARGDHGTEIDAPALAAQVPHAAGPEDEAVLADSVGAALVVVLELLTPAERLAFVLHDMFAVSFEEIGTILSRTPQAAKQLAMRARSKVRSTPEERARASRSDRRVVDAFLAASRAGDFAALIELLHPDVGLDADRAAVAMGSPAGLRGREAVAGMFSGRALGAEAMTVNGAAGLAWVVAGAAKVAWEFTVVDGRVARIDMVADADALETSAITAR